MQLKIRSMRSRVFCSHETALLVKLVLTYHGKGTLFKAVLFIAKNNEMKHTDMLVLMNSNFYLTFLTIFCY